MKFDMVQLLMFPLRFFIHKQSLLSLAQWRGYRYKEIEQLAKAVVKANDEVKK